MCWGSWLSSVFGIGRRKRNLIGLKVVRVIERQGEESEKELAWCVLVIDRQCFQV